MDKVVHFEIPYEDEERAKEFYRKIFDWKIIPVNEMSYNIVHTGKTDEKGMVQEAGFINGGLYKRDETGPTPVIVINVENIEKHIKKIESAGGNVVMPVIKVGDMGLYARVQDTEKNIIGIWQDVKNK